MTTNTASILERLDDPARLDGVESYAGMPLARDAETLRAQVSRWQRAGLRVALVPTMGALHAGHLSLIDAALAAADRVIISIFVNPKQFGPGEDLERYPRTFSQDCALSRGRGAHLCYAPSVETMYPEGFQTEVRVGSLTESLCGASRPHFFAGVTTVVAKLLNAAMADVALFGEKDFQQLRVVQRMARDLNHPTQILGAPTIREADGLAMSSRNAYLSPEQRIAATSIYRAISAAQRQAASAPAPVETEPLCVRIEREIREAGGEIDYVAIVEPLTLRALPTLTTEGRLLVAASFGQTRLIDNAPIQTSE